jgi:hypothetical protein
MTWQENSRNIFVVTHRLLALQWQWWETVGRITHSAARARHKRPSFLFRPPPTPTVTSVIHAKIGMDVKFAPNSQELRELIQGPGDVEWRCVSKTPFAFKPFAGRVGLSSTDTTCGISVRRSCLVSCSAPFRSPKISPRCRSSAFRTCTRPVSELAARRPELFVPIPPTSESAFATSRKLSQFALVSPIPSSISSSMYRTQRSRT